MVMGWISISAVGEVLGEIDDNSFVIANLGIKVNNLWSYRPSVTRGIIWGIDDNSPTIAGG